jgi:hypothetical protein
MATDLTRADDSRWNPPDARYYNESPARDYVKPAEAPATDTPTVNLSAFN